MKPLPVVGSGSFSPPSFHTPSCARRRHRSAGQPCNTRRSGLHGYGEAVIPGTRFAVDRANGAWNASCHLAEHPLRGVGLR